MRGIVLEGGAAKGAYHVGAVDAILEKKIEYRAVSGTSIGAVNGAFLVSGQWDLVRKMWPKIDLRWFLEGDRDLRKRTEGERSSGKEFLEILSGIIRQGGISTDHMLRLIDRIDEEAFRASETEFAFVAVNRSLKEPRFYYKDDIPEGKLAEYLLASSFMPIFRDRELDGQKFLDGCFYDNLPYEPLERIGVDEFIAVRCQGFGVRRPRTYPENRIEIKSEGSLGRGLDFSPEHVEELMKRGYEDAVRVFKEEGL